jgi:thymidylate synthase ThyX
MEPNVFVIDDLAPEDNAMLQALYSRSPASVQSHLERVRESDSGAFMSRYYVGYNHKSIADCGSTSIFIEGISLLAAKAIQDNPLYSGQESSTRYIDFSKQPIDDPIGTPESELIQREWMNFYLTRQEPLAAHIRRMHPRQEGEDEKVYERAVQARVFDILRGFLPAGATTNVAWHTNLRQAYDKLSSLIVHPDKTIANIAEMIAERLSCKYPNSKFDHLTSPARYAERKYQRYCMARYAYSDASWHGGDRVEMIMPFTDVQMNEYHEVFQARPRGAELPRVLDGLGVIESKFRLDFGSFRDLQRHRNGLIRMPLLSTDHGFCSWYLDQMPADMEDDARVLLYRQTKRIEELDARRRDKQYYCALGYNVVCEVQQSLPAFVYRVELRSSKTVHPTLRRCVLEEVRQFRERYPNVPLHVDDSLDYWTIRRGEQTIEERERI